MRDKLFLEWSIRLSTSKLINVEELLLIFKLIADIYAVVSENRLEKILLVVSHVFYHISWSLCEIFIDSNATYSLGLRLNYAYFLKFIAKESADFLLNVNHISSNFVIQSSSNDDNFPAVPASHSMSDLLALIPEKMVDEHDKAILIHAIKKIM